MIIHQIDYTSYIYSNQPNLTTVVDTTFPVVYNIDDEECISTEIFKELKKNNGCLFAFIKIPASTVFTISDGNHRTYAIHQLINSEIIDTDIEGLYVGIDFYLEVEVVLVFNHCTRD